MLDLVSTQVLLKFAFTIQKELSRIDGACSKHYVPSSADENRFAGQKNV